MLPADLANLCVLLPCVSGQPPFCHAGWRQIPPSLLQGDKAVTLQPLDSVGLLLDAEKPPNPGTLCLCSQMHHISPAQHGVEGPWARGC